MNELCLNCMSLNMNNEEICTSCGFSVSQYKLRQPHSILPLGYILNKRYIIGTVLGKGGFAITYIAWDTLLKVPMAIKEFYPGEITDRNINTYSLEFLTKDALQKFNSAKNSFLEEARVLASFNEVDGIVPVQDIINNNNTVYIVMFYVEGITLSEFCKQSNNKLSPSQAKKIIFDLIQPLKIVHSKNFIHRDISPDNIFITKANKVMLLDFGAARKYQTDNTQNLSIILKHGYTPVEQYIAESRQGPFTDIYALAATYYRLLTGTKPQDSMSRLLDDKIRPLNDFKLAISVNTEKAIMKALSVNANERQQTLDEFFADLTDTNQKKKNKPLHIIIIIFMLSISLLLFSNSKPLNSLVTKLIPNTMDTLFSADKVKFTDNEFEKLVKFTLKKDTITKDDLDSVNKIVIAGSHIGLYKDGGFIGDITQFDDGRVYYVNGVKTSTYGQLSSVSDLIKFNNLTSVSFHSVPHINLSSLGDFLNVKKITKLEFFNMPIDNITFLSAFENLEHLSMRNTQVSSIEVLSKLRHLKTLALDMNSFSSLTPLEGLYDLQSIDISGTNVTDISPLENCSSLKQFTCFGAEKLKDTLILKKLTNLNSIILGNYIKNDLSDNISALSELEMLRLEGCNIEDISFLKNMRRVRELWLNDNFIKDISPLKSLSELEYLNLKNNLINDYSVLDALKGVTIEK